MKHFILLLICLGIFYSCKTTQDANTTIAISNVNIVNVVSGEISEARDVIVRGNRIVEIRRTGSGYSDTVTLIRATGKYLIPGLWDMHTHFHWNYKYSAPLLVANGVTGIREMWGDMGTIMKIRSEIENGDLISPSIVSSGTIIDGVPPIWPGSSGVGNAEEAYQEAEKQIAEGVDFLKVYSRLSPEAYQAIAGKSRETGVPFAGHIPNSVTIWEAMESGQKSFEHMYGLLEGSTSRPDSLELLVSEKAPIEVKNKFLIRTFSREKFDSLASMLAKSEMWVSPTLTVIKSIANLDDTTRAEDPRLAYMPDQMASDWDPRNDFRFKDRPDDYYDIGRKKYSLVAGLLSDLDRAGARIIAGTDYPNPYCYPGFSLHEELQLMVEAGMSPVAALRTATWNPAVFLGVEGEIGNVEEGYLANLVLLDSSPLESIDNTERISGVLLNGRYMDRSALDDLLEKGRRAAKKN